ncbi:hypothetical protein [Microbacterium soli]|uniref:Uncharacterized protein n=1 Tax=Microbacterium soli TaxID=446075 RepID=A0ABP7NK23_9MICO
MSTTVSYGASTFAPVQVDGWEQQRESRTVVHQLLAGGVEVTHRPAAPRTFTLTLIFPDEADAAGCADLHRTAPYLDLVSDERALVNGRYVLAEGAVVTVALDEDTRDIWVVTVEATEVDP